MIQSRIEWGMFVYELDSVPLLPSSQNIFVSNIKILIISKQNIFLIDATNLQSIK